MPYYPFASRRSFLKIAMAAPLANSGFFGRTAAAQTIDAIDGARSEDAPIAAVRFLGEQFLGNQLNITGLDGATSTPLPSGDALWMFGDTVEGPFESIRKVDLSGLRSNVGALVPTQNAKEGIKKFNFLREADSQRPRQLIPFAEDENPATHRIWPIHGVCVGQAVYLFYHRITLLKGVDVFENFQLDGMGIARADVSKLEFTRLTAPDGTREFWKGDQPTFGVFVTRDSDHVFLWGSLATKMYLARTKPDKLEDFSSFEYLVKAPTAGTPNGEARWSNKLTAEAALFDSVPNEMSASYNPHLKKFVAVHSLHRENKIVMRTAPRIVGPWSAPQVVYRPEKLAETDLIYAAKEHPELARDGGRVIYVTYVNSASYVPQMIEVTFN